ncbi:MAG: bifunctional glutamate N-acetyltransferase/amino-acid acetyltransferase ArgJ [Gammaproteobacteria bacterium]|nr:bifunctional glutamate N-acetyltransferase/amino-acid acetyltransferase ArgJ [Gammaproteobacteria bacterium]
MSVGETIGGELLPVDGCEIAVLEAGIRYPNRRDLVIFKLAESSQVAASFTQNRFCAAPVTVAKKHLEDGRVRALVVNTGNANAGTGPQGLEDASNTCDAVASLLNIEANQVLPFSTGVIGELLPMPVLIRGIEASRDQFDRDQWLSAAHGIMTTDTVPKGISKRITLSAGDVVLTGISKGAGMIKPNMATMLSFVATDAVIDEALLVDLCQCSVDQSFNRITVDGDTSTNDACVLIATGASKVSLSSQQDIDTFRTALDELMLFLATAIVRDAEGATKFIRVRVNNARSSAEACKVGYAVAESPLVKTAFFASDPNWGRILAAVGRAGIDDLSTELIDIFLEDVCIVSKGGVSSDYSEAMGQEVMNRAEIEVTIDLGRGNISESIYTSDLSHDYVSINADYRS